MKANESRAAKFWRELKRRKVVRVAIAYVVVGWALIQVADATIEPLHLPDWAGTLVVWLVALGFPIAIILAWTVDITPRGIEITGTSEEESEDVATPALASPKDASIAVLPFVNISGDPENEYFSDGLSEELLNLLTRLKTLRVCSRTTSFALKGKDIDMTTIAKRLGVRHVLEGGVRRDGERVRITAKLIDAREDRNLWSESFDRNLSDIFAIQEEIAQRIFNELKLSLTPDQKRAAGSTTNDVKALDCYLRGRELYHRTEPGHLQKSREKFEEAIRIDPEYALAYAGLTYIFVDTYWYVDKDPKWLERARESSRKSVELAPQLAESHCAFGYALRADEQFEQAEAEFNKAIDINPNLFEPVHFYAQMLRGLGQFERAAELFLRAGAVRPEDYQALSVAANIYEAMGDLRQARAIARQSVARAERAVELNPRDARALYLGAGDWQLLGNKEQALEWIEKAAQVAPDSAGVMYNSACVYAKYGESDRALDFLEKAVDLGSRNKRYYETESDFESIRDHPRFKALMDRI